MGEEITQEYDPFTSRRQAKKAFRLYPAARQLQVTEKRQEEEAIKERTQKVLGGGKRATIKGNKPEGG